MTVLERLGFTRSLREAMLRGVMKPFDLGQKLPLTPSLNASGEPGVMLLLL